MKYTLIDGTYIEKMTFHLTRVLTLQSRDIYLMFALKRGMNSSQDNILSVSLYEWH